MIPLSAYVAVSAVLFIIGLLGVLIRRNFIIVLMSVEIMRKCHEIDISGIEHNLHGHQHDNKITPDQDTEQSDDKEDCADCHIGG